MGFNFNRGYKESFAISSPSGFRQTAHVGFDPDTGEFEGLPSEWEVLLGTSGLSKDEVQENPERVLRVLQFHQQQLEASNAQHDDVSLPRATRRFKAATGASTTGAVATNASSSSLSTSTLAATGTSTTTTTKIPRSLSGSSASNYKLSGSSSASHSPATSPRSSPPTSSDSLSPRSNNLATRAIVSPRALGASLTEPRSRKTPTIEQLQQQRQKSLPPPPPADAVVPTPPAKPAKPSKPSKPSKPLPPPKPTAGHGIPMSASDGHVMPTKPLPPPPKKPSASSGGYLSDSGANNNQRPIAVKRRSMSLAEQDELTEEGDASYGESGDEESGDDELTDEPIIKGRQKSATSPVRPILVPSTAATAAPTVTTSGSPSSSPSAAGGIAGATASTSPPKVSPGPSPVLKPTRPKFQRTNSLPRPALLQLPPPTALPAKPLPTPKVTLDPPMQWSANATGTGTTPPIALQAPLLAHLGNVSPSPSPISELDTLVVSASASAESDYSPSDEGRSSFSADSKLDPAAVEQELDIPSSNNTPSGSRPISPGLPNNTNTATPPVASALSDDAVVRRSPSPASSAATVSSPALPISLPAKSPSSTDLSASPTTATAEKTETDGTANGAANAAASTAAAAAAAAKLSFPINLPNNGTAGATTTPAANAPTNATANPTKGTSTSLSLSLSRTASLLGSLTHPIRLSLVVHLESNEPTISSQLSSLCSRDDPNKRFKNQVEVGQGYAYHASLRLHFCRDLTRISLSLCFLRAAPRAPCRWRLIASQANRWRSRRWCSPRASTTCTRYATRS